MNLFRWLSDMFFGVTTEIQTIKRDVEPVIDPHENGIKLSEAKKNLEKLEIKVKEVEALTKVKMDELDQKNHHLDKLLNDASSELDRKSAILLDKENLVKKLNGEISEKDSIITNQRNTINHKNEIISKIQLDNRVLNDKKHDLMTQNEVLKSEVTKERTRREKIQQTSSEVMSTLELVKHANDEASVKFPSEKTHRVIGDVITNDLRNKTDVSAKVDLMSLATNISRDFTSNLELPRTKSNKQDNLSDRLKKLAI